MSFLGRLFGKREASGVPDESSPLWAQGELPDALLDEWRWLVREGFVPAWCTACGDLFLQKGDGAVYLLDTATGSLLAAAKNAESFEDAARESFDAWWKPGLFAAAARRAALQSGQCYSWIVPPRLGGTSSGDNLVPRGLAEHFATLGKLFRR